MALESLMAEPYSPLRYPGGKAKLAEFLVAVLRCNRLHQPHYVEPYAGGAGAALRLLFEEYVEGITINDADPRIRCFWQAVTKYNDAFLALIEDVEVTVEEWRQQRMIYEKRDLRRILQLGFATFFLNQERSRRPEITSIKGVPYIVPLILILLVVLTYLLSRTSFGRHVYAVGGNTEAARRAGINVRNVKIACFVFCSTLAAVAGILFASRDNSISPSTGGSTTLLFAVAAAVMAVSTSAWADSEAVAYTLPVAGLTTSVVRPSAESTY